MKKTVPENLESTDLFYRAFEDRFRGSRELIKSRLGIYLPFILPLKKMSSPCLALDLGCGRGEWLELLTENGLAAKGVDLDQGMLLACQERGLDVSQTDALDYLRDSPAGAYGVISAFHLVEHVPFEYLRQMISESLRALKPGGLLILETPNSENLVVGSSSFYLDPTHRRPIPALLLNFIAEYAGFSRVKTLYLQESSEVSSQHKINLLRVLDGVSPDYSIVAQKKASADIGALLDEPFGRSYGIRLADLANRYEQQQDAEKAKAEDLNRRLSEKETQEKEWISRAQYAQGQLDLAKVMMEKLERKLSEKEMREKELAGQVQRLQGEWESEKARSEELTRRLSEKEMREKELAGQVQRLQNEWESEKAKVENISHQFNDLLGSTSWRWTKPARLVGKKIREIKREIFSRFYFFSKRVYGKLPFSLQIKLKLKKLFLSVVGAPQEVSFEVPPLIQRENLIPNPIAENLSPRAARIYADLRKAMGLPDLRMIDADIYGLIPLDNGVVSFDDTEHIRLKGWSNFEESFVWSLGNEVKIFFMAVKREPPLQIKINLGIFKTQRVEIYLNNAKAFSGTLSGDASIALDLPAFAGKNELRFCLPDAESPGADSRVLALALKSIEFIGMGKT